MGNVLILKNADFSANAVSLDNVYDVVKETDEPSLSSPMGWGWVYNNLPFTHRTIIRAVKITLPSVAEGSFYMTRTNPTTEEPESAWAQIGLLAVGAANPSDGTWIRMESTRVDSLVQEVARRCQLGDNSLLGSSQVIRLTTPVVINSGECVIAYNQNEGQSTDTNFYPNARFMVYAANVGADNPRGNTCSGNSTTPTTNNLAVTFYGEIDE